MQREDLKLNDFEGFEDFLFTKEERELPDKEKWKKYFDVKHKFVPPILNPKTIEEHQLCHYAYWKVIFVFALKRKPRFTDGETPTIYCYACEWCNYTFLEDRCTSHCPIRLWHPHASPQLFEPCTKSGSYFYTWVLPWSHVDRLRAAETIATLPWTDLTKEDQNDTN